MPLDQPDKIRARIQTLQRDLNPLAKFGSSEGSERAQATGFLWKRYQRLLQPTRHENIETIHNHIRTTYISIRTQLQKLPTTEAFAEALGYALSSEDMEDLIRTYNAAHESTPLEFLSERPEAREEEDESRELEMDPRVLQLQEAMREFKAQEQAKGRMIPVHTEHGIFWESQIPMLEELIDQFGINENTKYLDVGTGDGLAAFVMAAVTGARVTSIEVDPERYAFAKDFEAFLQGRGLVFDNVEILPDDVLDHPLENYHVIYFYYTAPQDQEDEERDLVLKETFLEKILRRLNERLTPGASFVAPLLGSHYHEERILHEFFQQERNIASQKSELSYVKTTVITGKPFEERLRHENLIEMLEAQQGLEPFMQKAVDNVRQVRPGFFPYYPILSTLLIHFPLARLGSVMVDRDRVGSIGLQLNGIRARRLRRFHDGEGATYVTVMIARQLRDDERGIVPRNPTPGDRDGRAVSHAASLTYQSARSDGAYPAAWNNARLAVFSGFT